MAATEYIWCENTHANFDAKNVISTLNKGNYLASCLCGCGKKGGSAGMTCATFWAGC